jgi:hypothetical protein
MNVLNTTGLDNVSLKNSAKEHITSANLILWIVSKVETLPNYEGLKYNPELILYVSSCIEVACVDNKIKCDKLDVFIQVYKKLFEMTTNDEVVVVQTLNFLHKNLLIKGKKYKIFNFIKKGLMAIIPLVNG